MRPGFKTFGKSTCSGLRHLQADTHLLSWLNKKGIEYDIVTDDVLNDEGVSILSGYKAVSTTTHPEYHTFETLNALKSYRDDGGALVYLGGNGFTGSGTNKGNSGLIEIRRSEDGLSSCTRARWYYYAFDGKYGGLWRRLGRPPQKLVGVGFTAQANFVGMPFERVCFDQEFDWVFEGINQKIIGNYGLSGGGAAGFELDRIDNHLDDGQNITVLAQSYDTKNQFVLVPEELLTLTNLSGQPKKSSGRTWFF